MAGRVPRLHGGISTQVLVAVVAAGVVAVACATTIDHLIVTMQVRAAAAAADRTPPTATATDRTLAGDSGDGSIAALQRAVDSGTRTSALVGTAVVLVLGLAIGMPLSRRASRRLGRLEAASAAMAKGDLHQQLDAADADEIDKVTTAFNTMSASVAARVELLSGRLGTLSLAIARLNVLGDTLAQSRDVTDALEEVAGLVRGAFGARAALLALQRPGEPPRQACSGARRRIVRLRAVGERALREGRVLVSKEPGSAKESPSRAPGDRASSMEADTRPRLGVTSRMAGAIEVDGRSVGFLAVERRPGECFDDDDAALLGMIAGQVTIALRSADIVRRLESTNLEMVQALATAMEAKDQYTATHAENIATMAVAVGKHMGLDEGRLRELEYAAVLHDVGKIGVPGHILNKPDRLTALEYTRMTQHTTIGERIVSRVDYLKPVARIVRAAHERWDGSGYPDGLAGEDIPLLSRILFVCDAYDAMTSDRRYRKAMPDEEARAELQQGAGTQFDPIVVKAFLTVAGSYSGAMRAESRSAARTA